MEIKNSDTDLLKIELKKNLKEIFDLQEQRVHLSNEFETRFKEYLLDAPHFDLNKLKDLCKEISERMNSISKQVLEIKLKFSPQVYNSNVLFKLVERLQNHEQIKFKLVFNCLFAFF